MLVAAGILTANMLEIVKRWKLEGGLPPVPNQKVHNRTTTGSVESPPDLQLAWTKTDYRILPNDQLGPAFVGDLPFRGSFVVYDWEARSIIWREEWRQMVGMVAGVCFADGDLFIADLEAASIFQVDVTNDVGKLLKRISHPYLNDIHSLVRTKRGLLTTCSGNDLIVELDLDGAPLWEWWAADYGYSTTPSGHERPAGRDQEHRDQYYHTRFHTTHVNDATFEDADERFVLALLFHQGQLIRIDRDRPAGQQTPEIVLDGLARPHGLEKTADGWLFCNSLSKELLLLDDDLAIKEHVAYDGGWIQDCTMLSDGRILLNDVDNHRIVELAPESREIANVIEYDQNWRMGELVQVPTGYDAGFRRTALTAAAD